ncbi:BTAD domain-containing putative transcriptional regulator [Actinocorallia sp. A-T 12471]|uniref:BTAD domain-containing putative transcriptional regulator n=1 Tax=Actinocorallia sp. A-T 12471 TaxID=3089813 RepID=UPI0029CC174E|nr:BTAD domain-containing putative transcriptional regulator [Actinocorallia sp. A-T 12471]MDX6739992.1 BTAD domain-containing putative transcriptional regulator [Actinocorallia sp. A-T 12471]
MRFGILGPVEARDADGGDVPLGGPGVRALLGVLLLEAGRVVPAESLIDALYGEDPPDSAPNALQARVSRLRRALDGRVEVELGPGGYRLGVDPRDVDAHRFRALLDEAADLPPAARLPLLDQALALWRGPALADVPALRGHAVAWEEARASAVEERGAALLALGLAAEAVAPLRALVAAEPLRERARALLMRALYGTGRQGEALEAFEEGRRLLADELGADPSAELAEAHLEILRAVPAPRRTAPRLPARLTSLVGRDADLARITELLEANRLLTLIGPGGTGKTRLAVETADRADGLAVFADLVPVPAGSGPDALALAVGGALGLREVGVLPSGERAEPVARLCRELEGGGLLVLDNCEHVVDGAAGLAARLLAECPDLRVLATSREPLSVTGETLWPVRQLAVAPTASADAADAPAVRLFADRAAAVRPGYTVDDDLADVVAICAALDGVPLAIELAAARMRALSAAEVAAALGDRFALLSRGDRSKSPRHRSLRAVVEWSWDLLTPAERRLAWRLTVFTGGFTAADARAVCDADPALLLDLADKSLIARGPDGRYSMLETIAAFCAEHLAASGEEPALRRAHAEHFYAVADAAGPHLIAREQLDWLALLRAEQGNLHTALRHAVRADPALGMRLVAALLGYWWLRGTSTEAAAAARELLAAVPTPPPGLEEEYAICVAFACLHGETPAPPPEALAHADAIMRRIANAPRRPFLLALWAVSQGPPHDHAEQVALLRAAGPGPAGADAWSRALLDLGYGMLRLFDGDPEAARPPLRTALDAFTAIGERWGIATTRDTLSVTAELAGDLEGALALLDGALDLVRELDSDGESGEVLLRRADILLQLGRTDEAARAFAEAETRARRAGAVTTLAELRRGRADLAAALGDRAEAERLYLAVLADPARTWSSPHRRAASHYGLALLAEHRGDTATARTQATAALTTADSHPLARYLTPQIQALLTRLPPP